MLFAIDQQAEGGVAGVQLDPGTAELRKCGVIGGAARDPEEETQAIPEGLGAFDIGTETAAIERGAAERVIGRWIERVDGNRDGAGAQVVRDPVDPHIEADRAIAPNSTPSRASDSEPGQRTVAARPCSLPMVADLGGRAEHAGAREHVILNQARVDAAFNSVDERSGGGLKIVDRQTKVACQQVHGPERDDSHGDGGAGERLARAGDRSIPTSDDDGTGAGLRGSPDPGR